MTTQLQHLTLPEDIQQKLLSYKEQPISPEFQSLIGTSGYEAEDEAILFDAIIALAMGKNVLLKGPISSFILFFSLVFLLRSLCLKNDSKHYHLIVGFQENAVKRRKS